jgi:hypothetical protein
MVWRDGDNKTNSKEMYIFNENKQLRYIDKHFFKLMVYTIHHLKLPFIRLSQINQSYTQDFFFNLKSESRLFLFLKLT